MARLLTIMITGSVVLLAASQGFGGVPHRRAVIARRICLAAMGLLALATLTA